jgi:hypothetical protein
MEFAAQGGATRPAPEPTFKVPAQAWALDVRSMEVEMNDGYAHFWRRFMNMARGFQNQSRAERVRALTALCNDDAPVTFGMNTSFERTVQINESFLTWIDKTQGKGYGAVFKKTMERIAHEAFR